MATRYYCLNTEDGEELYFSVGAFERQIVFHDQKLTISNDLDRLPKAGSDDWGKMNEVTEQLFNFWFRGAIECLNSINWGRQKKPENKS